MPLDALPIDEHLPRIVAEVRRTRAAVVVAAPGAGKTTRIPPALMEDGRVVLLQPRRVAARAIARRIAAERGAAVGGEIGWQVRFERRFGDRTRLLVVTEGILTARLQSDPLLSEFSTIVIDEFHERSVHADLALALGRQAWRARNDLRIVIMSATLDAAPVARFLGDCPVIEVPGRAFRVDLRYRPEQSIAGAAAQALAETSGDALCFLAGAAEIERAAAEAGVALPRGVEILPLHGSLDSDAQDRVFSPATSRRLVLATNIAETSITVPRVTAVVDAGFHKIARYDAARAIDSLVRERVTGDAADQRAGRAGRVAPGVAIRLWDARDRLRPHREPEIARVDLSATVLDVIASGGDPTSMDWFERPPEEALASAGALLERLGAIQSGRLTTPGRALQEFPLHPRLGTILLGARGAWDAAVACAVLSERTCVPARSVTTTCDLLSAIDDLESLPPHVTAVARHIEGIAHRVLGLTRRVRIGETELRRAILSGYPDRVAQRRAPASPRLLLASGTGAVLTADTGVTEGEFVVALDVQAAGAGAGTERGRAGHPIEARVRIASRVERDWLRPTDVRLEYVVDKSGAAKGLRREMYGALELGTDSAVVPPDTAARLIAAEYVRRGQTEADVQLLRRLAFARVPLAFEDLAARASLGVTRVNNVSLVNALPIDLRRALERLAPERLRVPSGRTVPLEYRADGTVVAAVKLQELFGLAETPRVGPAREPVVLSLLAPNGRPVQTTRDLKSFWERTYPDVRKELRGRYPKHPWPEDPWSAAPTARTKKKGIN